MYNKYMIGNIIGYKQKFKNAFIFNFFSQLYTVDIFDL